MRSALLGRIPSLSWILALMLLMVLLQRSLNSANCKTSTKGGAGTRAKTIAHSSHRLTQTKVNTATTSTHHENQKASVSMSVGPISLGQICRRTIHFKQFQIGNLIRTEISNLQTRISWGKDLSVPLPFPIIYNPNILPLGRPSKTAK